MIGVSRGESIKLWSGSVEPSPAALIRAAFRLFDSRFFDSTIKNSRPLGRHFYGGADESMGELKKVPILPELNLLSILFRGIFSMVRVLLPPLRIKVKYSSYKYIRLTKIVTSAFLFTKLVHDKLLI